MNVIFADPVSDNTARSPVRRYLLFVNTKAVTSGSTYLVITVTGLNGFAGLRAEIADV